MFGVSADTAIRYANAANEMLSTDLDDADTGLRNLAATAEIQALIP